jgi:hypothetical protein
MNEQYSDPDYIPVGGSQWDNGLFSNVFAETLEIKKTFSTNYITENTMQMIFIAEEDARTELDYFKNLIVDNYYVIDMTCNIYNIDYLYMKIVDSKTKNVIFELCCSFEDAFELTMSVGLDYINELE